MDDPVNEIRGIVLNLTTGNRTQQQETLETYFTPDASFKHPFCAIAGFRGAILLIFQWYKILSPKIEIEVNSVAFDETNLVLYLNISQVFKIWFIPYYRAPVTLTTILHLVPGQSGHAVAHSHGHVKYFIRSQEDLYQTDEWIKFILPFGIGVAIVRLWYWNAALLCIAGAKVFGLLSTARAGVKKARAEVVEEGKPMLAGGQVMEVEDRRDSKGVKEVAEAAMKGKEAADGITKVGEVDEGTVRVKERANGKKSVREMERKANIGEAK